MTQPRGIKAFLRQVNSTPLILRATLRRQCPSIAKLADDVWSNWNSEGLFSGGS